MNIPVLTGMIRRRVLVNYRVEPEVVAKRLPEGFTPKLYRGHAIAGICLIRLENVRPKGFPAMVGITSENAAHRFAVEWVDEEGVRREGVYISRRDTGSRLNALAGGRGFPGVHHHARFHVRDDGNGISVRIEADDLDEPLVELEARDAPVLPAGSIFRSLEESSRFFEAACTGYSPRPGSRALDGLRLEVQGWRVTPLHVETARSAVFGDTRSFPPETIAFDHALLMRDILHAWRSEPVLFPGDPAACPANPAVATVVAGCERSAPPCPPRSSPRPEVIHPTTSV